MALDLQQPVDVPQAPAINEIGPPGPPPDVSGPPAMPTQAAPQQPSLWKTVLAGALQGLAGSAGSTSFGGGLAQGTGAVIQNDMRQKQLAMQQQEQQRSQQLAQAQIAHYQIENQKTAAEISQLAKAPQQRVMEALIKNNDGLIQSGAMAPVGDQGDYPSLLDKKAALIQQDPNSAYQIRPVGFDKSGDPIFQTFKYQNPQAAKADLAKTQATIKANAQVESAKIKANAATSTAQMKANKASEDKAGALMFGSMPDGTQVAGSEAELKAANVSSIAKLPADEAKKAAIARELISPVGLFNQVASDMSTLEKAGKLGVAASRWNDFMAGKVGSEPDFAKLRTDMGLLATALMQAHVGARGSHEMLEHFKSLADYRISDPATLKAALGQEWHYVHSKAMLIPKGQ